MPFDALFIYCFFLSISLAFRKYNVITVSCIIRPSAGSRIEETEDNAKRWDDSKTCSVLPMAAHGAQDENRGYGIVHEAGREICGEPLLCAVCRIILAFRFPPDHQGYANLAARKQTKLETD